MTDPAGRRHALFVANDTYHSPGIARLHAPVSDAHQLRELLRDPEIGAFQPTELLVNESKAEIERNIERLFRGAGPEDVVLFYFSGHGIRTRQNLYLATSNTELPLISSSAVSSAFIKELIRESDAAAKIILLDCCYSGAFLGNDAIKAMPNFDDVGHDLATGDGICVLTASTAIEIAEDGNADRSAPLSVFTAAMVKGIGTGLADNGSGRISTHDLWTYVSTEVRSRTVRQTPSHYGVLRDEVYVARARRATPALVEIGDRVQLGDLLGRLELDPATGLRAESWWGTGKLRIPIGQERRSDGTPGEVMWLDLARADGNLLIVGRAGSGKSTLLRTFVGAMALTHTPEEARAYVLESSNRLGSMRGLPHLVGVVGDDELEQVELTLQTIVDEIRSRKKLYREHNIDSPTSLRAVRSVLAEGPFPDVFLILDRWSDFSNQLPEFENTIRHIASAGPEYAVHVVTTARDWSEAPDWLADLLPAHIELRLHRPAESRVNPERAARLPDSPGWALLNQRAFRIALPDIREFIDESMMVSDMADGAADLVAQVAEGWSKPSGGYSAGRAALNTTPDFAALYGLDVPVRLDTDSLWQPRNGRDHLRIPIGTVPTTGERVELDFKESAANGMGPHGLLVGATGSGKSELLKAIVVGLSLTHSPEMLNFFLVDVNGHGTFRELSPLPHVSSNIADVTQDLPLVERIVEALSGEANRRQEVLREAGNFANVTDYERARATGAALPPMPTLLIVVDEFTSLAAESSRFEELLVMIGRLGRSLAMHLLLSTQRLDTGKLRALESHMSYQLALRVHSAEESRAALGTKDAYLLPSTPGAGYLRTGSEIIRFQAVHPSRADPSRTVRSEADAVDRTLLETVVAQLRKHGRRARAIWLPPLDAAPTLDRLFQPSTSILTGGYGTVAPLLAAVGIVDRPYEHRLDTLILNLAGASGHVAVVGGPQSGKSTLLCTLILAMSLTHTVEQVQFYCLDFGGGSLSRLGELPHTGSIAGRLDTDRVRRTVAEMTALLRRRETQFAELGIESMAQFRVLRATDPAADTVAESVQQDPYGDVFLVVDGFGSIRQDFETLEQDIMNLAAQGLSYGIHIVVAVNRWAELRPAMKDSFTSRVELRLADPLDSDLDRKVAAQVPRGRPGRGMTSDRLHMLTALPRIDGRSDPATLRDGVADAVSLVQRFAAGHRAPAVRMLPERLHRAALLQDVEDWPPAPDSDRPCLRFPIGINESELAPVYLDFTASPHLIAFGDIESGKTTLLRSVIESICASNTRDQARILVADYRRTLLDHLPDEYIAGYASSAITFTQSAAELAKWLEQRQPGTDVTPQQLRDRSWWHGPEMFLIVDDYDLVATSSGSPMHPLLEHLSHARDLGFHVILTRRSGGASRALYDPIIGRMRELGSAALIMSGSRDEGMLWGAVRPQPMPPGRGILVNRISEETIQTAYVPMG
ncbi:type VII secretion protein EccCb [Nocardia altamirensis]|uniref:type VII secretion protein EccCb n=1 Tax=Nocardia altamirensis TaxID=472158 RepID=UPI0008400568|nr:type VII secretion protein EccCb [Nocardia altamirensis]